MHLLNEFTVMSYYLLPPVNHQQADLFYYHNYNDRLRLADQWPIGQTQFMDLKLHLYSPSLLGCVLSQEVG